MLFILTLTPEFIGSHRGRFSLKRGGYSGGSLRKAGLETSTLILCGDITASLLEIPIDSTRFFAAKRRTSKWRFGIRRTDSIIWVGLSRLVFQRLVWMNAEYGCGGDFARLTQKGTEDTDAAKYKKSNDDHHRFH